MTALQPQGPDDHLQGAPARLPARHDERLATHTEDSSGCYSIEPSCQQGVSDPVRSSQITSIVQSLPGSLLGSSITSRAPWALQVSPLDGYPERAGDQEKKTPRALKTQKLAHSVSSPSSVIISALSDLENAPGDCLMLGLLFRV